MIKKELNSSRRASGHHHLVPEFIRKASPNSTGSCHCSWMSARTNQEDPVSSGTIYSECRHRETKIELNQNLPRFQLTFLGLTGVIQAFRGEKSLMITLSSRPSILKYRTSSASFIVLLNNKTLELNYLGNKHERCTE